MSEYQKSRVEEGEKQVPTTWLAEAIGLSRKCLNITTATEQSAPRPGDDTLKEKIITILSELSCYGYRRITAELKRAGETINHKRVARVMRTHNLTQKRKKRTVKTTNSNHHLTTFPNLIKDLIPDHPLQVFASDITYVRLEHGFCYVALIIDTFTRRVVGWAIDTHMETSLVVRALEMALAHGVPEYHHSDRGGQYCSHEYTELLRSHGVKISMADPGLSVDNPHAESMNKTLKVEEVYLKEYRTVEDAERSISTFLKDVYNPRRLHSSLGYVPPAEFETAWYAQQADVGIDVDTNIEQPRDLQAQSKVVSLSA